MNGLKLQNFMLMYVILNRPKLLKLENLQRNFFE